MGPLTEWPQYFKYCQKSGFNMIHFAPLQPRGFSNSPYSITDQDKLSDDLFGDGLDENDRFDQLNMTLGHMRAKYQLLGMIDVVWNHTSSESLWLRDHPEAGYNLDNSPHLKCAFDLDELIIWFSGHLQQFHLSGNLLDERQIRSLLQVFKEKAIPLGRLWEYFVMDIETILLNFKRKVASQAADASLSKEELWYDDGTFSRFSKKIKYPALMARFCKEIEAVRANLRDKHAMDALLYAVRTFLNDLNLPFYKDYDNSVDIIIENLYNRIVYERVAAHGPKLGPIDRQSPLSSTYFTRFQGTDGKDYALANNGWIWNADPFQNFAEAGSASYFLREIIVWGDCVKLRYGQRPEESPFLWQYMTAYTELMAKYFDAFRIDNCHSTPIHVAEYLLSRARSVRPNLYVCAELFTGSEEKDVCFVKRLGIDSLIREAMIAWDTVEATRLVLSYGGQPFGSFLQKPEYLNSQAEVESFCRNTHFSRPHNIFFECTHDNEPPTVKRLPEDALSNAALVAFTCSAIGSNFTYDQLIPHHINIVTERRRYSIDQLQTMMAAKTILNRFHDQMALEGCVEVFSNRYANDVLLVSRVNPSTHQGYTLITRAAYKQGDTSSPFDLIEFNQLDVELLHLISINVKDPSSYEYNESVINGLGCKLLLQSTVDKAVLEIERTQQGVLIRLLEFKPGSVIILRQNPRYEAQSSPFPLINSLDLIDVNYLLYRCDAEERDDSDGQRGVYDVPGFGTLPYCGLQGFHALMELIMNADDLSHAFCQNLREGPWAADYIVARLDKYSELRTWFMENFVTWKLLPSYLKPKEFRRVVKVAYEALTTHAFKQLNIRCGSLCDFGRRLALGSVQMLGKVKSTGLHPFKVTPSLSAGLPHFATHHMRCWGRDIFISLRGLLLETGRFQEAREHLLAAAGCCYRGLIPNLLDAARRPRFNARDATWWFLQALQDYCLMSPDGLAILDAQVPLRFSVQDDRGNDVYIDFDDKRVFSNSVPLHEIVKKIIRSHIKGIQFREWNAGPQLDSAMRSEGFDICIEVDWRTGFIYGGNRWNCGTWMDKMGESVATGNRGHPSTPRFGAPIEIVALLKSALDWLHSLDDPRYGLRDIETPVGNLGTWASLIKSAFEREFYVPLDEDSAYRISHALVQRRGIYKDCCLPPDTHEEGFCYQFRPNCIVALSIVPDLFEPSKREHLLALADDHLCGPLGMRTLDPSDPEYSPDYHVGDSTGGANYHQGPEWLWLFGCYLKGWHRCLVACSLHPHTRARARHLVLKRLQPHRYLLERSVAAGLPELTNRGGSECRDGCWSQAWSFAIILEVIAILQSEAS